ncbi:MAG: glycosyltransferase family 39 protein [Planctomycetota bacterium]|nr:glycosyltransferase family 39 protein [Planctomycetota bacterium]
MPEPDQPPVQPPPIRSYQLAFARFGSVGAIAVVLALLALARLAYLVWFCPYTLIEDEAHYWEWSSRLDWAYYSKGPGVAAVIALATRLFGDAEWVVRLPAIVSASIFAASIAWLTRESLQGVRLMAARAGAFDRPSALDHSLPLRAAFVGAILPLLIPAYSSIAMLMTIDGPYVACWALACCFAMRALRGGHGGLGSWRAWIALGVCLAAGIIFKYTMLLFIPGLVLAMTLARITNKPSPRAAQASPPQTTPPQTSQIQTSQTQPRQTPASPPPQPLQPIVPGRAHLERGLFEALPPPLPRHRLHPMLGLLMASGIAVFGFIPPLIWNAQHDWATFKHLLGHLGLPGGDMPATQGVKGWSYDPRWTLDYLGTQLVLIGPALALMVVGGVMARRAGGHLWKAARTLLALGGPILAFYFAVSFVAEPEGNWAIAGYISLLPLAAIGVVLGIDDWRARVAAWRALPVDQRPRAGVLTRRPETRAQVAWHVTLAFGIASAILPLRLDWIDAGLAALGASDKARRVVPMSRLTGADRQAAHARRLVGVGGAESRSEPEADQAGASGEGAQSGPLPIIAAHYGRASQLAYYLNRRATPPSGSPAAQANFGPSIRVLCASAYLGGRKSQYDVWPDTSLALPATLPLGSDALLIGATEGEWQRFFERVEPLGPLEGDRKRGRPAFRGFGFRGVIEP